jgi:ring-1,2-phenylacetyl-CoA epoxidase subunit PaaB
VFVCREVEEAYSADNIFQPMDTQWPRWEVFQQQNSKQPFRNAGSVHAPDAQMALDLARDVFTRRPDCIDYFVVRADDIYARTAEELATTSLAPATTDPNLLTQPYLVFCKQTQRAAETYVVQVGEIDAQSPETALAQAIETFGSLNPFVWWVCPASAAVHIDEDEKQSLFAQMHSKPYRQPQYYKVVEDMRRIKTGKAS